jgi:HNH endonuclease
MLRLLIAAAVALAILEAVPLPWNALLLVALVVVLGEWTRHPVWLHIKRATRAAGRGALRATRAAGRGALRLIGHARHDRRILRARAKAGLSGPLGDRFECPRCGRLSTVRDAMTERDRLVTDWLNLPLDKWDQLDAAALKSPQPIRVATFQKIASLPFDDAEADLWGASRVLLLAAEGNGYRSCRLFCPDCYQRAGESFEKDLNREPETAPVRPTREPIPAQLRFRVLSRDHFRCQYCGRSQAEGAVLHLDHVVPFSKGGPTTEDNLITACMDCNLGKSAQAVIPD